MYRGLLLSLWLCHAQHQDLLGEDEQSLLQARARPRSPSPANPSSSLLSTVRNLAQNVKHEAPETVITLVSSIESTIQAMKPPLQTEHDAAQAQLDVQFAEIEACGNSASHGRDLVDNLANKVAALEECAANRAAFTTARDDTCADAQTHADRAAEAFPASLSNSPTAAEIAAYVQA